MLRIGDRYIADGNYVPSSTRYNQAAKSLLNFDIFIRMGG
jgi:hypothetical protein